MRANIPSPACPPLNAETSRVGCLAVKEGKEENGAAEAVLLCAAALLAPTDTIFTIHQSILNPGTTRHLWGSK